MHKFTIGFIVALVAVAQFSGCIKQEVENLKETNRRVQKKLDEFKNRVSIDPAARSMLEAVHFAYKSSLESRAVAPTSWSDMASAPGLSANQRVEIRNAKNKIKDIVWGAKLENLDQPENASAKLVSLENQLTGDIIILQADGGFRQVSRSELDQIPLAN